MGRVALGIAINSIDSTINAASIDGEPATIDGRNRTAQVRNSKSKRRHAVSDAVEIVRQTLVFSGLMAGLVGLFVVFVRFIA